MVHIRLQSLSFMTYFTSSSRCFSTFPHGTRSLSISTSYIGTLKPWMKHTIRVQTGFSTSSTKYDWSPHDPTQALRLSRRRCTRFHQFRKSFSQMDQNPSSISIGYYGFHSPLLAVSRLVFVPGASNMLKFTPFPYIQHFRHEHTHEIMKVNL